ncbi:MAG: aminotransferase class V-fold PLP-dependent enzyme [Bacteroidota bacterium]
MEDYFSQFRKHIVGINQRYNSAYGEMLMLYADWIASGRLYSPIEKRITENFGSFVGNTHTETSESGTIMTNSYRRSKEIIKKHVNASPEDVLISSGFGMTGVINKFQRILGLKACGINNYQPCISCSAMIKKPVVFVTHMEHHSNHTSWYETVCDVVVVEPNEDLLVDLNIWEQTLQKYADRPHKFASITACSNVTGIVTPYHEIAALMHRHNAYCFVDFAASAPYYEIDMHPKNPAQALDAIFFSPHKFLGGPGSSGILVFNKNLYRLKSPDQPGGGTVDWTNAWGEYKYIDDIESREDGGTPGFLQTIKAALAIRLKEQMGVSNILRREEALVKMAFEGFRKIKGVHILADNVTERLGVISFYTEDIHYNLIVRLLNDKFGIQVRGGCACAGTYGHYLLHVGHSQSKAITDKINRGDLSMKPGWVRLSLHPTMTDAELSFILNAIEQVVINHNTWANDYNYNMHTNEFTHKHFPDKHPEMIDSWFDLGE